MSTYHARMVEFEKGLLARALADSGGNQKQAANALGMPRSSFLSRCQDVQPTDADAERVFRDEAGAALTGELRELAETAATLPFLFKRYELKVYAATAKDRRKVKEYEFNRLRKTCETIAKIATGLTDRFADALGVQPECGPRHDEAITEERAADGAANRP